MCLWTIQTIEVIIQFHVEGVHNITRKIYNVHIPKTFPLQEQFCSHMLTHTSNSLDSLISYLFLKFSSFWIINFYFVILTEFFLFLLHDHIACISIHSCTYLSLGQPASGQILLTISMNKIYYYVHYPTTIYFRFISFFTPFVAWKFI